MVRCAPLSWSLTGGLLLLSLTGACGTQSTDGLQEVSGGSSAQDTGGSPSGGAPPQTGGSSSGGAPPQTGGGDSGGSGGDSEADDLYFDGKSRLNALPETPCTVKVSSAEISPDIATVGIVTFTTNLANTVAAEIHFGPDTDYGLVAPVDLTLDGFRTLLLGMRQDSTYHYRVAVSDGTSVCYGNDQTIQTGSLDSIGLSEARTDARAAPGFFVTSAGGTVMIFNKEGELVWSYKFFNTFSAQMSWDGQYMIGRDPGPFDQGDGGNFYRVKMDGSEATSMDAPGGDHHDFTVTPDGIAYLAKETPGECDKVYEASLDITDGAPVFDTWPIYQYFPDEGSVEGTELCHANRLHYLLDEDIYTVSDRNKDAIAIFNRDGTPLTSIGKAPNGDWTKHIQAEGAGPGGDWHVQHGHHFYADDKLVVFSNDSTGGSAILHYTISGDSATLDWKYSGAGASLIQGDVQRLPNGNFLVTANISTTIVELSADGQSEIGRYVLDGPGGALYGFNYTRHRSSLYGAPAPR